MNKKKNPGGRPTKLNKKFIEVMERVVNEHILYCTDEDLILLINEQLPEKDQIAYRTWFEWKGGHSQTENSNFQKFLQIVKKALINERRQLLENLKTEPNQWQRWAWILERKFTEWNLKKIIEADVNNKVEFHIVDFDDED